MDEVQRALEVRRFIAEVQELRRRRSRLLRSIEREAAGLRDLSKQVLEKIRGSS